MAIASGLAPTFTLPPTGEVGMFNGLGVTATFTAAMDDCVAGTPEFCTKSGYSPGARAVAFVVTESWRLLAMLGATEAPLKSAVVAGEAKKPPVRAMLTVPEPV